MKISLGTDIGGTNTCVGSVSPDGKVLHKETFSTSDYSDGTAYADRLAEAVRAVISQTESQQPEIQFEWLGLGIGAPNGNHRSGCIEHPPNLNFKGITPLVELMQARPRDTCCEYLFRACCEYLFRSPNLLESYIGV